MTKQFIERFWNSLGPAEREQAQMAIRELWQDALERGASPYREFMLEAVRQERCGYALQYAVDELKADPEIAHCRLIRRSLGPSVRSSQSACGFGVYAGGNKPHDRRVYPCSR